MSTQPNILTSPCTQSMKYLFVMFRVFYYNVINLIIQPHDTQRQDHGISHTGAKTIAHQRFFRLNIKTQRTQPSEHATNEQVEKLLISRMSTGRRSVVIMSHRWGQCTAAQKLNLPLTHCSLCDDQDPDASAHRSTPDNTHTSTIRAPLCQVWWGRVRPVPLNDSNCLVDLNPE